MGLVVFFIKICVVIMIQSYIRAVYFAEPNEYEGRWRKRFFGWLC